MSDDTIRTALAEAGEWAEQQAALPGPAQARKRSRSRSNARVAGTAALTVLALLGAVFGIGRLTGYDPADVLPAGPPVPTSSAVPTTIPEDFELGPDWSADPAASGGPADRLPFDVCPGAGIPGVDSAVDRRFTWVTAHESGEGQGLLVFADADGAVAFMSGLRSAADRCAAALPRPHGGTSVTRRGPLSGAWGEGAALVQVSIPAADAEPQPLIGTYLLVVRVGSAVALQVSAGEFYVTEVPAAPPAEVVATVRPPLDALAPKLCRWTVAGC
jgi:hypothetical protein